MDFSTPEGLIRGRRASACLPSIGAAFYHEAATGPQWYNLRVSPVVPPPEWEAFLARNPQAHLLQTAAWGELKAQFGWSVERIRIGDSGAQILFRRLPLGWTLAYIPRGPVGNWLPGLLPQIDETCRRHRAFALVVEPDVNQDISMEQSLLQHGFRPSPHPIQPRRTLIVNLEGDENQILGRMHQKTRYNIRLASRKGVLVRSWDDLRGFGRLMRETAARDRFGAHADEYYETAYRLFKPAGMGELLVAELDGEPLAALMVFAQGARAWYLYGASTDRERNRMPTYLLQWEAIRWAMARGCTEYDLWGVPDAESEVLEAGFEGRGDGLWGVYRFKRGFGGSLRRSAGAWDRVYVRPLFRAYRLVARLSQGPGEQGIGG
ncbi:MAG TPA: peptidoglycan bridge formation glycyltransferase FemA/FemB family protein [Anaerolineales bacterium]|nr:peptidoglycan bridge formation glycyltransferase FemA/FemB family protein [Anaerolineales bacterium]